MGRLVCDGVTCASAEVAGDRRQRARGLLRRDGIDGGFLLPKVRGVHTLGMRFALDVAFIDGSGTVIDVVRMPPWRVGRARRRARSVLEAEAGAFSRWGIKPGAVVRVEEDR